MFNLLDILRLDKEKRTEQPPPDNDVEKSASEEKKE